MTREQINETINDLRTVARDEDARSPGCKAAVACGQADRMIIAMRDHIEELRASLINCREAILTLADEEHCLHGRLNAVPWKWLSEQAKVVINNATFRKD